MIKKKQYSSYKDSGIDGIGKIPEHWETNKIKNLFEFSKGLNITKKDLTETGIPVISYGQIHAKFNDGIHIKDELIRHTDKTKAKTNSKVSKGDFIFADTSEDLDGCGNSIYINKEMLLYGGYHDVILKSKINRDNTYLAYLFQSKKWRSQIKSKVSGVKVYSINQSILKECYIILPNTDEQEQIAKYLDKQTTKIDQTVTKNKKLITLLKEKRTTLINQTVTKGLNPDAPMKESGIEWIKEIPKDWKINKIKNMFEFTKGLNITKKDLTEEGIPVISYGQIHAKFNDGVHITEDLIRFTYKSNAKTNSKVSKGDFIFADTSEDIEGCGNSIYVNKDMLLYGGYHDVILKSKNRMDNTYLAYLFQSSKWRSQIRSKVSGVKVYSINQSILKECYVLIPPVEEKNKITEFLNKETQKIDETIEKIERNIELLEEYKESLIHHVVTGKIDVRGVEV